MTSAFRWNYCMASQKWMIAGIPICALKKTRLLKRKANRLGVLTISLSHPARIPEMADAATDATALSDAFGM